MEQQTEVVTASGKGNFRWGVAVVVLVVLVILYCLSFGPAMRLKAGGSFSHHRRTTQIVGYFYAPIIWSHNHTPLRKPIEAYVNMWLPKQAESK